MDKKHDNLLMHAMDIAVRCHSGTFDRYGAPYIFHPLRVMDRVTSRDEKIVALLHDVIEDCAVTPEMLLKEGIPESIVDDIDLLSKREGEDYDGYMSRVMTSHRAARVKIADLEDNMDIRRMSSIEQVDLERLRRYHSNRLKLLMYLRDKD
jgi:(p)ppGpp synthase/HD superfamily hydrolase